MFYVPAYRVKTAKFCSLECQNHKQYDKYRFCCEGCGKHVETSPSRRNYKKKFCSTECRWVNSQNEKVRRRKIKAYNISKRGTTTKQFRKYVFEIVEKKCQFCGYCEHDFCLDLHHIDKDCTNNNIDNIAVLCVMCHRKLHKGIIKL